MRRGKIDVETENICNLKILLNMIKVLMKLVRSSVEMRMKFKRTSIDWECLVILDTHLLEEKTLQPKHNASYVMRRLTT